MSVRKNPDRRQRLPVDKGKALQGAKRSGGTRERLEVLAPGRFTPVPREEIAPGYKSTRLKFVLVKPGGRPYLVAHEAWLCFTHWCGENDILLLDDKSEDDALKKFKKSGWTIHHAEIIAVVGEQVKKIEDEGLTE